MLVNVDSPDIVAIEHIRRQVVRIIPVCTEEHESKCEMNCTNSKSRLFRMRRLAALDEPDADDNAISQDVGRLPTLVGLVLCLADELGLDLLRALDLDWRDMDGAGVQTGQQARVAR